MSYPSKSEKSLLRTPDTNMLGLSQVPPIVHDVLRSPSQQLDGETRAIMEPRFGHDFSRVRMHTDAHAAESAWEVNALAYTVGRDVVFGAGQYAPETGAGRQLVAHELAHVLQQATQNGMPILQRACAPVSFDFAAGPIAGQIRDQLRGITVPPARPGATLQPRVDPNTVIAILASSSCFLGVARQVQQTYFTSAGQPRIGGSPLVIHLHEEPEIGSEFVRGAREHRVEVEVSPAATTVAPKTLVRTIVHEIVHASHRAPMPRPRRGAGTVTSAEEAGITEEASTRLTENEIMSEIAASQGWTLAPTPTGAEEVRADLRSGLPQLTYQEFFIVEEMKNRHRVPGVDEASSVSAARHMANADPMNIDPRSATSFQFTAKTVKRERKSAAETPIAPLGIDEALECASQGQGNQPRANPSVGCQELLRILQGKGPLPYEPAERRRQMHGILMGWNLQRYQREVAIQIASSRFIRWYDSLPPKLSAKQRDSALRFFQWVFIAESMSREWQGAGADSTKIRRDHLDFLNEMIGRGLHGISRPPSP